MKKAATPNKSQPDLPTFGEGFLDDHAGHIVSDPRIAIIELIANAYDAGASEVDVIWPSDIGQTFVVGDNGTGMSREEFDSRWRTLCYNRLKAQGADVVSPNKLRSNSIAFGKSGKGRHGAFCFADSYDVETWKNGNGIEVHVERTDGGISPFRCSITSEFERVGHGTVVRAEIKRHILSESDLKELIGSKFAVDPSFQILVNREAIQLRNLKSLSSTPVQVGELGSVTVHRVDSEVQDRTVQLRGIAWWVNGRAVGTPTWEGLDGEGAYLDGRTSLARRYSFIVEADLLIKDVKEDWSEFRATASSIAVRNAVHKFVLQSLNEIQASSRKERKRAALSENRAILKDLPKASQNAVAEFVQHVQETCPTLSERDLFRTAEIFGKMERARSGFDLLKRLNDCSPDDLDAWNDILQNWSAGAAQVVLGELESRLKLIQRLQELVHSPKADELHDLQPLFERGLWMFGPEYDAVDFHSNRYLATIIRESLGGTDDGVLHKRPDFVALPDRSIGIYGAAAYGVRGDIVGLRKILVVELKKGGFNLTQDELDQARNYARELYKGVDVLPTTETIVYVLGAKADQGLGEAIYNKVVTVVPMLYRTLLDNAQARTFNLQRQLEKLGLAMKVDPEVEEVLQTPQQSPLFNNA